MLVKPPIWLYLHFQVPNKVIDFDPGVCSKGTCGCVFIFWACRASYLASTHTFKYLAKSATLSPEPAIRGACGCTSILWEKKPFSYCLE